METARRRHPTAAHGRNRVGDRADLSDRLGTVAARILPPGIRSGVGLSTAKAGPYESLCNFDQE